MYNRTFKIINKKAIIYCGDMLNMFVTRYMGKRLICTISNTRNCFDNAKNILTQSSFTHCKYKTLLRGSHQKRPYAEDTSSKKLLPENISSEKSSPSLYSKYGTDVQFDVIKKFLEQEKASPSVERWMELKQEVLSIKGGKVKEVNADGVILSNCVSHLEMAKSFIKFLNHKYKKITPLQMSQLFRSFYTNQDKCTPEDKAFIKKMFFLIVEQKNTSPLAVSTVEGLVAGISITDEWKQGILLMDETVTKTSDSVHIPLIEAAISHEDMDFAFQYLREHLKKTNSLPESLLNYWIRHISTRPKMNDFLGFLQDSNLIITKSTADLLAAQCSRHKDLYSVSYTSIDTRSRQCHCCRLTLDHLTLDPLEFDRLKQVFLNRTLVGSDIFQKTTPAELDKFLSFLDKTRPYDIVMDALNVSHTAGIHKQPQILNKVVTHFLDRGANLLVLGRDHMLRWPSHLIRPIQTRCQFFFVDNLSQDDPYLLYAAMHASPNTQFVSRDLMRSHIYLLRDHSLRATFLKWQQLNQILILSASGHRVQVSSRPAYGQHVQGSSQRWHVPYRVPEVELTFSQVYNPKPTWLCLQERRVCGRK